MKLATFKNYDLKTVTTINYAVAAIGAYVGLYLGDSWNLNLKVTTVGLFAGTAFVVSIFVLFYAIRVSGVAITMTISRVATVTPIGLSIFLWDEIPSYFQVFGFLLVVWALIFLGSNQKDERPEKSNTFTAKRPVILFVFLTSSAVLTTPKLAHQVGLDTQRAMYLFILFSTSSFISLMANLIIKSRIDIMHILVGVIMGVANIMGSWLLLVSMKHLDGIIVFPVFSCSSVMLTAILAKVIWRENLARRSVIGIGIAVLALLFVNI